MKKSNNPTKPENQNIGSWVILKNNQFIIFNKPATLPIQADKTGDKSLLDLAEIYTKQKLFLCNRIDRPASGIVIFAKTSRALAHLNEQIKERKVSKTYLAVTKSPVKEKEGHLINLVEKNQKVNKSYIVEDEGPQSKKAELYYKVINSSDNYALLEVNLITGRHHQIRVQLSEIGHPIKGDVKYGDRRSNKDKSIHLHAWKMSFTHPISGEKIDLEAKIPDESLWNYFAEGLEQKA